MPDSILPSTEPDEEPLLPDTHNPDHPDFDDMLVKEETDYDIDAVFSRLMARDSYIPEFMWVLDEMARSHHGERAKKINPVLLPGGKVSWDLSSMKPFDYMMFTPDEDRLYFTTRNPVSKVRRELGWIMGHFTDTPPGRHRIRYIYRDRFRKRVDTMDELPSISLKTQLVEAGGTERQPQMFRGRRYFMWEDFMINDFMAFPITDLRSKESASVSCSRYGRLEGKVFSTILDGDHYIVYRKE
mgnify:CR=1 FL=1